MKIGILSDSHDRAEMVKRAVALLEGRGAEFFIHCGDVCSGPVLDALAGLASAFVWGNCDWDRPGLESYAKGIDVACHGAFADLHLGGKRIAVIHGDDAKLKSRLLQGQEHDYLFQGHTHVREDTRVGRTRVINPGALHRASVKTVALLDTQTDALEYIEVGEG